jgi:peptidyl-prolyl cis-trans isomerase B (cyclophilin B)
MRRIFLRALVCFALACAAPASTGTLIAQSPPASIVVVDTAKGTFAFETFPNEAPATVAHVVELVKAGFYDGQRIHRAAAGFVVQFGDPQTRDVSKREQWGKGAAASSGHPLGVSEVTKRRQNVKGAVGIAHMHHPTDADSQIYITLSDRHDLDGRYAVFGQVIEGQDVLSTLRIGDEIRHAYIRQP